DRRVVDGVRSRIHGHSSRPDHRDRCVLHQRHGPQHQLHAASARSRSVYIGNPPPGWPLPPAILDALALQRIFLPRTAFTYLNLGPLRQKGFELSLDQRLASAATAFANYSYQSKPTVKDDPNPFPASELAFPPMHRFNAGVNVNGTRWLGSAS